MCEITVLTKAILKTRSLRTMAPTVIVKQFALSEGDKLRVEDRELIISVKSLEEEKGGRHGNVVR